MTATRSSASLSGGGPASRPTRWDPFLVALSTVVLTSVWRIQDLFPILGTVQIPSLAAVAMLILFLADRDPRRKLKRLNHPVVKLAVALFALTFLSVPGGVYPGFSLSFILKDFSKTFVLLIMVAAGLRDRKDVERLMTVILVGAVVYAFIVITRIPVGEDGRLGDLYYYDANDLGMLLVMTIPMVVFFMRSGVRPLTRMMALASLLILMVALVKTGSRGGFLGLMAVGGFMLWRYRAISKKLRLSAVSVMVVLLLAFGSDRYWTMMSTMLHPSQDYNFSGKAESGRMEIWKRGIGYMMSHPLTGVGANAFPAAEGMISPLAARQQLGIGLKWSAAHNSFVEVGAELGIAGLVLFITMLVKAGRALAVRGRGATKGGASPGEAMAQTLAASLVGFCVAGFFLSQGYSAFLYTLLGLVASPARLDGVAAAGAAVAASARGTVAHWRAGVPRFGPTR